MDARFEAVYGAGGRMPVPPEKLLRALLPHMLYSVLSESMQMEQMQYNLLVRWS